MLICVWFSVFVPEALRWLGMFEEMTFQGSGCRNTILLWEGMFVVGDVMFSIAWGTEGG